MTRENREAAIAVAVAGLTSVVVLAAVPTAGDTPAHLYRSLLLENGAYFWDNLWYGGHYPFVAYSVLYYLPAGLIGHRALVAAAGIASAALFASIATRAWGPAGRWPARTFAVFVTCPLVLGQWPYATGLTALLGGVRALQGGRIWLAVSAAALTLLLSPLAFGFLGLVLLSVFLVRPRLTRRVIVVGSAVALLAALQISLLVLFPTDQEALFRTSQLAGVLAVCVLGATLAFVGHRGEVLAAFFVLWGVVSVAVFVFPGPVGANITRPGWLAFPLVLAAASVARFRPRPLAIVAVGLAFAYNALPAYRLIRKAVNVRSNEAALWQPALAFLGRNPSAAYRVEAVPTAAHWEAYFLPRAGFAIARGWYRQTDLAENGLLYRSRVEPRAYRAWLRSRGVRYVVLPRRFVLDGRAAAAEASVLRSARSGLVEAFRDRYWRIFELPAPTPILTGPGGAGVSELGHERIAGWTRSTGTYRLRVRYSPYWRVREGALCVSEAADGMTRLDVTRPGRFVMEAGRPGLTRTCVRM